MHAYRSNEDPSARNKDEAEDGKRKACAVSDSEDDQEMRKEGREKEEAKESKLVVSLSLRQVVLIGGL